eukprot:TRINITY_DN66670_c0_g1_i3.p1 TRINITY_DN66670_c0_g1~~TRINITY_DN66670_c0_g1_i3.p1  ORF type:complete len:253 (-),score=32.30 TRINITY_DN66670_c0_g1_i3:655-1413(-)
MEKKDVINPKFKPVNKKPKKKRYRRRKEMIDRKFFCNQRGCGKSYGTEGALKVHQKKKHGAKQQITFTNFTLETPAINTNKGGNGSQIKFVPFSLNKKTTNTTDLINEFIQHQQVHQQQLQSFNKSMNTSQVQKEYDLALRISQGAVYLNPNNDIKNNNDYININNIKNNQNSVLPPSQQIQNNDIKVVRPNNETTNILSQKLDSSLHSSTSVSTGYNDYNNKTVYVPSSSSTSSHQQIKEIERLQHIRAQK